MNGTFNEIPLAELSTPKEGYVCMLNRYWLIGPNGGALSFDVPRRRIVGPQVDRHPQCNPQEALARRFLDKGYGGAVRYEKIPVAYWPASRE